MTLDPPEVRLQGAGAVWSVLVHGETADGRQIDLTGRAKFETATPEVCRVTEQGVVKGVADGRGTVTVEAVGRKLQLPVEVSGSGESRRLNFELDVVPILSRFGCNSSSCHGKAEGQNGFKLSVFGFDPAGDYEALVAEGQGRRVFPAAPERSLLLAKVCGDIPHGGGVRIRRGSRAYATLREWVATGLPLGEPDDPTVESVRLAPKERVLSMGGEQQLRVVATYSDGRQEDVTHFARFQSNQDALASVDEQGLVTIGEVPGQAAVMASYMGAVDVFRVLVPRPAEIADYPQLAENNFIDRLVHEQLEKLNIVPSGPASDATFLRRAYLDVIGTLPTAEEARRFLTDTRSDKRRRLVDELLQRPEYADYWALKWADLLRIDSEALGHKGAYAYYHWLRESVAANKPFDRMVRELLTAKGPLNEAPEGNFYQVVKRPGDMASTLSQVFLGVRIACAECHHHPFDRWSQTDYYGMTAYFQQIKEKKGPRGTLLDVGNARKTSHPRKGFEVYPFPLGGTMPEEAPESPEGDRRERLAEWFTRGDNPWFARNLANRMTAHFLGRGLVEPVDDVRETNPPTNPPLLDALAAHVVEEEFDLKELIRTITASATYQRSSEPNETNLRDEQNYSRALFKQMPAEVLLDAVCQTTGVEEKFPGFPAGYRAIQLWDSRVSHYFLKLFGRPIRVTACECERNAEPSIAQVLHLMNSPTINAKLGHAGGRVARLERATEDDGRLVEELYLTFYSRFPTDEEKKVGLEHLASADRPRRQAAEDLAWSLLNSLEFAFNH